MEFEEKYGWTAQLGSAPLREPEENRHPVLRLEKGDLWVETHGERGIDPQIMYERAMIEALRLEQSNTEDEAERVAIGEQLRRAQMEERVSQQMRREAAEVAAAEEPFPCSAQPDELALR
jgi:hypothetical protein